MSRIYICAFLLSTIIIYFLLNYSLQYLYVNHFNNLGKVINQNISGVIRHMVIAEDYLSIKSVLNQTQENNLISTIAVYSDEDIKLAEKVNNTTIKIANDQELFTPIYWQNKIIGYVYLRLNQEYLLSEIQLATKIIITTILFILLVTFFLLWLYCYTTDKYTSQAKDIFYQYFDKLPNPQNSTAMQLYALAANISKKNHTKNNPSGNNNLITANVVIKIKDKFIKNKSHKNQVNQLLTQMNIIAINCAKYCLPNSKIVKNNQHTISIITNSNAATKNIVLCALIMHFLVEEICIKEEIFPIGIGFCMLDNYVYMKNTLQYLFSDANKLAELSCENYICISQQTINNIPTSNINHIQHTNISDAVLIKATKELKNNIQKHAHNIKKFILQNN